MTKYTVKLVRAIREVYFFTVEATDAVAAEMLAYQQMDNEETLPTHTDENTHCENITEHDIEE